uniref:Uncharacterized protein n=1 Tax=Panagrolaimus sp. JU765 TaxID=591449 RepID=A0AC34R223_9BILA
MSENMKTSILMKRVFLFVFFSNFFAFTAFAIAAFMEDDLSKQTAKACFDFTILFYAYALPFIAIWTIRPWKMKLFAMWNSFIKKEKQRVSPLQSAESETQQPGKPDLSHLRNDYGEQIVFDGIQQADVYFSQLENSWK